MFNYIKLWAEKRKRLKEYEAIRNELGLTIGGFTPLDSLGLKEYTRGVLKSNGFETVADVLIAKVKQGKISGVGKKTWDDFKQSIGLVD